MKYDPWRLWNIELPWYLIFETMLKLMSKFRARKLDWTWETLSILRKYFCPSFKSRRFLLKELFNRTHFSFSIWGKSWGKNRMKFIEECKFLGIFCLNIGWVGSKVKIKIGGKYKKQVDLSMHSYICRNIYAWKKNRFRDFHIRQWWTRELAKSVISVTNEYLLIPLIVLGHRN